jgi:hypothetical protein
VAGVQAALAILERARLAGLDREAGRTAAAALAALPREAGQPWHAVLVGWLREHWTLPARPSGDQAPDLDAAVITALAGGPPIVAGGARLDWEGETYALDPGTAFRARVDLIRRSQAAVPLGTAAAFSDAVRALATGTPAAVAPALAAIDGLVPALPAAGLDESSEEIRVLDALARERRRLATLGRRPSPRLVVRAGRALDPVADRLLAASLVAVVYAAALPAGQTELLAARVHRRHDFGLALRQGDARARTLWLLAEPVSGSGVPWHLRGSLLSLDVALAPQRLRRISDEPPAPRLPAGARLAFARAAALMPAARLDDGQLAALAEAIAGGERRVAAFADPGVSLEDVAREAGVSAWRAAAWRWAREHAPAEPPTLSLTELLTLGLARGGPAAALAAWGASSMPATGELATRLPRPRPWEEVTGHDGTGRLAATLADLPLAIARRLHSRRLPAALAPGVLEAATADLVDRVEAPHPDDWRALVAFVPRLLDERFDDYVAALTADGPLRPVVSEGDSR